MSKVALWVLPLVPFVVNNWVINLMRWLMG